MITVLTGENSFEIQQALNGLVAAFDGTPERVDGAALELKHIPDLLMGGTLFADKRLVIIKDLSSNPSVWEKLPDWLPRISDDIHVVLIDEKPDKRTSSYKALKAAADVKEFHDWGDRDAFAAEAWFVGWAKDQGVSLDKKIAHHIVSRVGMNQWALAAALEKVALLDEITTESIDEIIEINPSENVFELFELALNGEKEKIHEVIRTLELIEDPYKLFALLSSQAFQLAAVASAGPNDNPAKDASIHPYVVSKLQRHAKHLGVNGSLRVLQIFADTDADMKTSRGEPWLLIEKALISVN